MLKRWVEQGVLLRDDSGGKRHTVYRRPIPSRIAMLARRLHYPCRWIMAMLDE